MSNFGETLFGGSSFVRWTLTPVLIAFAIWMPLAVPELDGTKLVIVSGLLVVALALLAGFWLPRRFGVAAFRLVCAIIFLAYAAYLFSECRAWLSGDKTFSVGRRSESTPLNALMGMVIIGLPALLYAWKGRFTLAQRKTPEMLAAERAEREERLLQPDWSFWESHHARPVPAALKELYADRELLLSENLDYTDECSIAFFEAISRDGVWVDCHLDCDPLVFAMSVVGDPIYLKPGSSEADAVYVTYHDGGDTQMLAPSVDDFVARLKALNTFTPPSTPPAASR